MEALLLGLAPVSEPLMEFFAAWSLRLRQDLVGLEVLLVMTGRDPAAEAVGIGKKKLVVGGWS